MLSAAAGVHIRPPSHLPAGAFDEVPKSVLGPEELHVANIAFTAILGSSPYIPTKNRLVDKMP